MIPELFLTRPDYSDGKNLFERFKQIKPNMNQTEFLQNLAVFEREVSKKYQSIFQTFQNPVFSLHCHPSDKKMRIVLDTKCSLVTPRLNRGRLEFNFGLLHELPSSPKIKERFLTDCTVITFSDKKATPCSKLPFLLTTTLISTLACYYLKSWSL